MKLANLLNIISQQRSDIAT